MQIMAFSVISVSIASVKNRHFLIALCPAVYYSILASVKCCLMLFSVVRVAQWHKEPAQADRPCCPFS